MALTITDIGHFDVRVDGKLLPRRLYDVERRGSYIALIDRIETIKQGRFVYFVGPEANLTFDDILIDGNPIALGSFATREALLLRAIEQGGPGNQTLDVADLSFDDVPTEIGFTTALNTQTNTFSITLDDTLPIAGQTNDSTSYAFTVYMATNVGSENEKTFPMKFDVYGKASAPRKQGLDTSASAEAVGLTLDGSRIRLAGIYGNRAGRRVTSTRQRDRLTFLGLEATFGARFSADEPQVDEDLAPLAVRTILVSRIPNNMIDTR